MIQSERLTIISVFAVRCENPQPHCRGTEVRHAFERVGNHEESVRALLVLTVTVSDDDYLQEQSSCGDVHGRLSRCGTRCI